MSSYYIALPWVIDWQICPFRSMYFVSYRSSSYIPPYTSRAPGSYISALTTLRQVNGGMRWYTCNIQNTVTTAHIGWAGCWFKSCFSLPKLIHWRMALWKRYVTPLLMHWGYIPFVLNHHHVVKCEGGHVDCLDCGSWRQSTQWIMEAINTMDHGGNQHNDHGGHGNMKMTSQQYKNFHCQNKTQWGKLTLAHSQMRVHFELGE